MKRIVFIWILFCFFSSAALSQGTMMPSENNNQAQEHAAAAAAAASAAASAASAAAASAAAASAASASAASAAASAAANSILIVTIDKDYNLDLTQHLNASCSKLVKKPIITRETTPEYFSINLINVINPKSFKEFFNITNNQYSQVCDNWYRKYLNTLFHKALVFAYDPKNISDMTSYWGFSYNSSSRRDAENNALKTCKASSDKIESHVCSILFSNNQIVNEDYLALAGLRIIE